MHRRFGPAVLASCFLLSSAAPLCAADEEPGDILGLFDQFVSSGAAATRCATPSDDVAVHFLSNFQWVSTQARHEISRRSPEATVEQVASALAARSQAIKDRTHALVRAEGCESDAVRELVRHFIVQSTWTPDSV